MELHSMKITGFFGRKEPVLIKFKDNKLIFVGENGLGKSTIMRILCYALTGQFEKLKEYIFSEITIEINNKKIVIDKNKLIPPKKDTDSEFMHFYHHIYMGIVENPRYGMIYDFVRQMPPKMFKEIAHAVFYNEVETIEKYSSRYVGLRECISYMKGYKEYWSQYALRGKKTIIDDTYSLRSAIRKEIGDIVFLYLPTYRRIERDSRSILGDNIAFADYSVDNYEEYVEFGMGDVETIFEKEANALKKTFNETNEKIRREYYLDVLNHKYESVVDDENRQVIKNLKDDDIDKVISNISSDKIEVEQIIESIKFLKNDENVERAKEDIRKEILCHFFLKFLNSIKNLEEEAQVINIFAEVCNKYLINKEIAYDSKAFKINIELKNIEFSDNAIKHINPSSLSSGEKQIVSLFCKLYLKKDNKKYFVMIDEPELSISVGWQKMFLKDVIESPKCVGLFAVTHSPFIYHQDAPNNKGNNGLNLNEYTMDLQDMKIMEEL